jgi:hypothetical protein
MRVPFRIVAVAFVVVVLSAAAAPAQTCPERVLFEPTANGSIDAGWTGVFHGMEILGPTLDLTIACPSSTPPCGACAVTGLTPTSTAAWRRCANDTSRACTVATEVADCGAPATCRTYLSPPVSFGSGLPLCFTTYVGSGVDGLVYPDDGRFEPRIPVRGQIRFGVDAPIFEGGQNQGCPRCVGDAVANDGVRDGTCDDGPRVGLGCDAHATSRFADYGATSFDCPHPVDTETVAFDLGPLPAAADAQTRTLSASSKLCSDAGAVGKRCFCSTCNDAAGEACASDADCPASGGSPGVCGGRRCLGGPNVGNPCTASSSCPSSACGRPGMLTKPNACLDDTITAEQEGCIDDGTGRGECAAGPIDRYCSNHPNRGCNGDDDCDGLANGCLAVLRPCFRDNGVLGAAIAVEGAHTAPVAGVSEPTNLALLACLRPSTDDFYDAAFGVPGLARALMPGRLRFGDAAGTTPSPAGPTPTVQPTPIAGTCPSAPAVCRVPVTARKSTLQITQKVPTKGNVLGWKWGAGSATTRADFGDPTATDSYALCLYESSTLRAALSIAAAGTCDGKPCWRATRSGFTYRSKAATADGLTQVTLRPGANAKARIQVKGKGALLPFPPIATLTTTLEMQLRNRTTGLCWGTTFVPPFDKVTATVLKDKAD